MSDPVCCILAVCCPGGSDRQRQALADALEGAQLDAEGGIGERSRERVYADWVLDHFDLAPKGTLDPLKEQIARLAKGGGR